LGGTLVETIRYPYYDHYPPEVFEVLIPGILSGTLVVTIAYKSHTQPTEEFSVLPAGITGGTIVNIPQPNPVGHTQPTEIFGLNNSGILTGILANG
jgi:hypothetical protein